MCHGTGEWGLDVTLTTTVFALNAAEMIFSLPLVECKDETEHAKGFDASLV